MRATLVALVFLALTSASVFAADISNALLRTDVQFTNSSGATITNALATFEMSTEGMRAAGTINAAGTNMVLCDTQSTCAASNEVMLAPAPSITRIEAYGNFDTSGSTTSVDTTDANDADANDVTIFDADPETGDYLLFGADYPFRIIHYNIGTAGAGTWSFAWEYCQTGGAGACTVWQALTDVGDGTESFTKSGTHQITWDLPDDWQQSDEAGALGAAFYVRASLTFTSSTTSPSGTQVWYDLGYGRTLISSIANGEQQTRFLFTGGSTVMSTSTAMVGTSASPILTIPADSGANPSGTDASIEIIGQFDAEATGAVREVVSQSALTNVEINWDSAVDGALDINVNSGADDCVFSNLATGIANDNFDQHILLIQFNNAVNCEVFLDGSSLGTDSIDGGIANYQLDSVIVGDDGSMQWLSSYRISPDTDPASGTIQFYTPGQNLSNYTGIALTDLATGSGDNEDATVTLATTTPSGLTGVIASVNVLTDPTAVDAAQGEGEVVAEFDQSTLEFATTTTPGANLPLGDTIAGIMGPINIPTSFIWMILATVGTIVALITIGTWTRNPIAAMAAAGAVQIATIGPNITIFPVFVPFFIVVFDVALLLVMMGRRSGV